MLLEHFALSAMLFTVLIDERSNDARMAMMAMTTSSSISVKPEFHLAD